MSTKSRSKGMVLVLVLMLAAILMILCSAYLSRQTSQLTVSQLAAQTLQAREIAYSGLESVRVRLLNDRGFPPTLVPTPGVDTNQIFTFSEQVLDFAGVQPIGSYQVNCDIRWAHGPWNELRVVVVGQVAGSLSNPVRYKMTGEFNLLPGLRGQMINLVDQGTY